MSEVLIIFISKNNIYLYLVAVLATFLLLRYHKRKRIMPSKKQLLDAILAHVDNELRLVTVTEAGNYGAALEATNNSWISLSKLIDEVTEGPF